MIIVYVTVGNKQEGLKIAKTLVRSKLVACANIIESESIYEFDSLQHEPEFIIMLKTRDNLFDQVQTEIKKMHSYEVPCILKIPVEANLAYLDWLNGQLIN